MDKIKIKNLEVFANHGVFPEENLLGQKFLISVELFTDTRKAGKTDELTDSIHYGEVCSFINSYMKENTFKLIEKIAESLAEELLLEIPCLQKVKLEVKKPWAPVGLPLETVSVEIERGWHTAYISLGSNMGEKQKYLESAVQKLKKQKECRVTRVSEFLETEPYGMTEQDKFLNGCLELQTLLTPAELLSLLHEIERSAGRERKVRWGPRTLDLDIIFYDDLVLDSDTLCIPHIDMQNRQFVLAPLCEIAPYKRHPVYGKCVKEMLEGLAVSSGVC